MLVSWIPQVDPPVPRGFVATGPRAHEVGRYLLSLPSGRLDGARGLAGDQLLLVLRDDLPWHDAVVWIAPIRPDLWLPTTLRPSVPASLLEPLLRREHPHVAAPWLILPGCLVPLGAARPIQDDYLRAWLDAP